MSALHYPVSIRIPDELFEELVASVLKRANGQRRFLSKPALATHYGVSERTVKTWREKGLPGRKVGREVMFCVDETDRWIDGEGRTRFVTRTDG